MKKIIIISGILLVIAITLVFLSNKKKTDIVFNENANLGATVCYPYQGCTGTSTAPIYGEVLIGDGLGNYEPVATSTLGISGGGGSQTPWTQTIQGAGYALLNTGGLHVSTSTDDTPFTINQSGGASTTIAVYNNGTGDTAKIFDSGTEVFTIAQGGNIGLASSSPGTILSIGDTTNAINFSNTGTTTFSHGIAIQGGCFQLADGTCAGAGGGGSGTINPGTTNAIAYYNASEEVSSANFLRVDTTNNRIGISTSTPFAKLAVVAEASDTEALIKVASSTSAYEYFNISNTGTTTITHLATGAMKFEADAGFINFIDLPVISASNNTIEAYTLTVNASSSRPHITVWSQANGSGGSKNHRVGVGTSSPAWAFSIDNPSNLATTSAAVGSATSASCFQMYSDNGTAYKVYVSNAGTLTTEAGSCAQ